MSHFVAYPGSVCTPAAPLLTLDTWGAAACAMRCLKHHNCVGVTWSRTAGWNNCLLMTSCEHMEPASDTDVYIKGKCWLLLPYYWNA